MYLTMLFNQVQVDIRSRYTGTFLGFLWAILNPLLFSGIYSFVIVFVFRARLNAASSPTDYIIFILSGLLPWLAFQESIMNAANSVIANSNIVKNLPFPLEIFPLSSILAGMVNLIVGIVIIMVTILISGRPLGWPLLFLPIAMSIQILFTLGFAFLFASMSVFIRDISFLLTYVFMIALYVSPVVYDLSMLPLPILRQISWFNPVYHLVAIYRGIFYTNQMHDLNGIAYLVVFSFFVFIVGLRFFRRTKIYFSDYLA